LAYGLIGLLLLGAFVGFLLYRFDPFAQPSYPTEAVIRGTFTDIVDINGTLQPRKQEVVTTALTGSISAIWVSEGDMVDEGQALFEVDTGRGYEDVTAPIAGQVVRLSLSTGKSFAEQNSAGSPGLVVADLTSMEVALDVNEVDVPHIAVGQTAVLNFDAVPNLAIDAAVTRVATLPNEGAAAAGLAPGGIVVTYPVTLELKQDDPRLKPGMSVSAHITVNEITNVLLVNALAVEDSEGSSVVYVQESNGEVALVKVNIIASSPSQVAVDGDLIEGEQVLIDRGDAGTGARNNLFTVRNRFSG
jgi:multidrug efflux pump subunit AcrA (membrane-fusion protein)